ncbi:hypothetical protein NDU88_005659 [Pleurodeles waltl]|uniref:Secreted protein n=1 Tax=Pleurodeles waltl TaxID=8319 RepID=A0AAV7PIR9_PLEWA|nr:hypothetical protein NDU88_005659 [Pleurodeles waltl]
MVIDAGCNRPVLLSCTLRVLRLLIILFNVPVSPSQVRQQRRPPAVPAASRALPRNVQSSVLGCPYCAISNFHQRTDPNFRGGGVSTCIHTQCFSSALVPSVLSRVVLRPTSPLLIARCPRFVSGVALLCGARETLHLSLSLRAFVLDRLSSGATLVRTRGAPCVPLSASRRRNSLYRTPVLPFFSGKKGIRMCLHLVAVWHRTW